MDRCKECGCLLSASADSATMCAKCEKAKQDSFRDERNAPAFPVQSCEGPNGHFQWGFNGMTKREWFAGMALQGLVAGGNNDNEPVFRLAECAFLIADAMIQQGAT